MAFKKSWFSSKVTSTDGYSVKLIDRATILYEDRKHRLYVSAEMLAPKNTWALYSSDIRIGKVHGKQLNDEALRSLAVERIQAVFDYLGWTLEMSSS
jgi:hypothetical protein